MTRLIALFAVREGTPEQKPTQRCNVSVKLPLIESVSSSSGLALTAAYCGDTIMLAIIEHAV